MERDLLKESIRGLKCSIQPVCQQCYGLSAELLKTEMACIIRWSQTKRYVPMLLLMKLADHKKSAQLNSQSPVICLKSPLNLPV